MTTRQPHARIWTEYRADGGRGAPITGTPGSYRVREDRVIAFIDQGAFSTEAQIQGLARQAERTRLKQATLVGPHAETRRVQEALRDHWASQKPTPLPKAPKPARSPKPKCGQPTLNGWPCRMPAGWGTDTVGVGACLNHGGSAEGKLAAIQAVSKHLKTVVKHARTSQKRPLTERERLEGGIALAAIVIAQASRKR